MSDETEYKVAVATEDESERNEKRPCLIMIRGDFIGQVYVLSNDVTVLGRADDADLVVSDVSISRRHAMIVGHADGFQVSDLGSTNGSFLNKESLADPLYMKEGDKLQIGNIVFKFTYQDEDDTEYHLMLRNMAVKDGLTRIYNKRYFTEALEKEFDYNRRNQVGLALILFDIDHFKQINDTWGHPAGDYILKHMAQLIEDVARGYDVFARWGGEEFVFLLRDTPLDAAINLADRVRVAVEEHVFDYDGVELKITISLGVTHWQGDDSVESPDQLLERADKHLYKAKGAGRNCIGHDPVG